MFVKTIKIKKKKKKKSYKVATKTFHVIQGPLNTFRLAACFLHEIPTGLYFMTFAAGL